MLTVGGCQHHVTLQGLQPDEIETTLLPIGDAGEPDPRQVSA
jgi:hypothetical protein